MIGFLPPFQKDETLYSYLANLYLRSGYLSQRAFMEDVFGRQTAIDKDFYNVFGKRFFTEFRETFDWKDVVLNHTCFKYFARFTSNEQRKAAWDTAMRNGGDLRKHIILPRNYNSKKERKLKFCPCCLLDQDTPYYSVAHQYKEASVCPVCGCHLRETAIRADSAHLGVFHPLAGESLPTGLKMASEDDIEHRLAKYIYKVNECDMIFDCKATIGEYLTFCLRGTKYLLGIRGGKKDMEGMHRDLTKYYEGLPNNSLTLAHLKFIFQGEMCNPYEICMIGMFLGIEPEDLARYGEKPIRPLSEETDERIMALFKQGKRYSEIAELLQCPRETVRKTVLRSSK